ncbi:MAG: tRNA (adenosine(37)-N6)-threonylcarbamoyltransferase complex ATPase subunit type 1 TsaE [Chitinophagaceae bacterium]|nr:MAG: tRNA (adenosine(37)-N6)-threonylcarbamoyltransferase complex ATPase subunit type 1 TsaE [Chitinophagaceae bacterium]
MEFTYSLENIGEAAQWLLKQAAGRKIIAFHGDLGAGKTTLISSICNFLNVKEAVSSPTFAIINAYSTERSEKIFHIDLYRLKNEQEAIEAGVEDCLASGSLCLVEWPERVPDFFTGEMHCYISLVGNRARKLRIIA